MILDIFKFIKQQEAVSHQYLAKVFAVDGFFLEDMINILLKKNMIKISLKSGCYKTCITCDKSQKEMTMSNCYYKIT